MHDIRWIRDNPQTFDRGAARRGLDAVESAKLIAIDERRRAAIQTLEAGAGAAQRGLEGDRRGQESKDEARAETLMAEVAALKETIPALEAEEKAVSDELDKRAGAKFPTCRSTRCRTARTSTAMSSIIVSGRSANYDFTPKQHFEMGEALGHDGFRDGGEIVRRALCRAEEVGWRGWSARSGSSCSMCIRASMATPKSIRRCWCATMRCSARRSCRSSRMISS